MNRERSGAGKAVSGWPTTLMSSLKRLPRHSVVKGSEPTPRHTHTDLEFIRASASVRGHPECYHEPKDARLRERGLDLGDRHETESGQTRGASRLGASDGDPAIRA